jgi:CheY-like chemotaxis protein
MPTMENNKRRDRNLVLVVDDDVRVRESMSELLEAKGYSVLQADDGQKALDVLHNVSRLPCIVVLDLTMPIMDGQTFLMLRSFDPVLRNVPVVVISGNMQSGAALEGIEAYLRKPVKIDSLINIIGQHC